MKKMFQSSSSTAQAQGVQDPKSLARKFLSPETKADGSQILKNIMTDNQNLRTLIQNADPSDLKVFCRVPAFLLKMIEIDSKKGAAVFELFNSQDLLDFLIEAHKENIFLVPKLIEVYFIDANKNTDLIKINSKFISLLGEISQEAHPQLMEAELGVMLTKLGDNDKKEVEKNINNIFNHAPFQGNVDAQFSQAILRFVRQIDRKLIDVAVNDPADTLKRMKISQLSIKLKSLLESFEERDMKIFIDKIIVNPDLIKSFLEVMGSGEFHKIAISNDNTNNEKVFTKELGYIVLNKFTTDQLKTFINTAQLNKIPYLDLFLDNDLENEHINMMRLKLTNLLTQIPAEKVDAEKPLITLTQADKTKLMEWLCKLFEFTAFATETHENNFTLVAEILKHIQQKDISEFFDQKNKITIKIQGVSKIINIKLIYILNLNLKKLTMQANNLDKFSKINAIPRGLDEILHVLIDSVIKIEKNPKKSWFYSLNESDIITDNKEFWIVHDFPIKFNELVNNYLGDKDKNNATNGDGVSEKKEIEGRLTFSDLLKDSRFFYGSARDYFIKNPGKLLELAEKNADTAITYLMLILKKQGVQKDDTRNIDVTNLNNNVFLLTRLIMLPGRMELKRILINQISNQSWEQEFANYLKNSDDNAIENAHTPKELITFPFQDHIKSYEFERSVEIFNKLSRETLRQVLLINDQNNKNGLQKLFICLMEEIGKPDNLIEIIKKALSFDPSENSEKMYRFMDALFCPEFEQFYSQEPIVAGALIQSISHQILIESLSKPTSNRNISILSRLISLYQHDKGESLLAVVNENASDAKNQNVSQKWLLNILHWMIRADAGQNALTKMKVIVNYKKSDTDKVGSFGSCAINFFHDNNNICTVSGIYEIDKIWKRAYYDSTKEAGAELNSNDPDTKNYEYIQSDPNKKPEDKHVHDRWISRVTISNVNADALKNAIQEVVSRYYLLPRINFKNSANLSLHGVIEKILPAMFENMNNFIQNDAQFLKNIFYLSPDSVSLILQKIGEIQSGNVKNETFDAFITTVTIAWLPLLIGEKDFKNAELLFGNYEKVWNSKPSFQQKVLVEMLLKNPRMIQILIDNEQKNLLNRIIGYTKLSQHFSNAASSSSIGTKEAEQQEQMMIIKALTLAGMRFISHDYPEVYNNILKEHATYVNSLYPSLGALGDKRVEYNPQYDNDISNQSIDSLASLYDSLTRRGALQEGTVFFITHPKEFLSFLKEADAGNIEAYFNIFTDESLRSLKSSILDQAAGKSFFDVLITELHEALQAKDTLKIELFNTLSLRYMKAMDSSEWNAQENSPIERILNEMMKYEQFDIISCLFSTLSQEKSYHFAGPILMQLANKVNTNSNEGEKYISLEAIQSVIKTIIECLAKFSASESELKEFANDGILISSLVSVLPNSRELLSKMLTELSNSGGVKNKSLLLYLESKTNEEMITFILDVYNHTKNGASANESLELVKLFRNVLPEKQQAYIAANILTWEKESQEVLSQNASRRHAASSPSSSSSSLFLSSSYPFMATAVAPPASAPPAYNNLAKIEELARIKIENRKRMELIELMKELLKDDNLKTPENLQAAIKGEEEIRIKLESEIEGLNTKMQNITKSQI